MNKTLLKIIQSREDLSDYLFHFTKGQDAKKTLRSIAVDKKLRDINNTGVICFTEAPLLSLVSMFDIFNTYSNPMYAPYGIAIKKDEIYKLGGRPVIYGLEGERALLDDTIKWRFEPYEPNVNDFTWLREWRLPKKLINIHIENCFVITNSKSELNDFMFSSDNIVDVKFDGCIADGQFWGNATGIIERCYKGISIEDLRDLNNLSKSEIDKRISEQNEGDRSEIGLGGFIQ